MIEFERFELENGLKVLVHKDATTPIVAMNIIYNVGARDENPELTGFAHLFEHLMFGGSKNIPSYDAVLEKVGGDNNAFTNNDFTNYYLSIPKENLETAFWLESDRMLELAFSPKSLEIQRNVVIEEYKQRYLNQPYGDVWLLLRPMVYKTHPYRWSTIGKDISHIENAKMNDVKAFYKKFYNPNNAILTIAGDVNMAEIKQLCNKWFAPINAAEVNQRNLQKEAPQLKKSINEVERDVPVNAIYKIYRMCARMDTDYHATDLLSDILANGKSSRLTVELHKKQKIFSSISAFLSGDIDDGMFVIAGNLNDNINFEIADAAIVEQLNNIIDIPPKDAELQKVKNLIEASIVYSEINCLDKAMTLGYFELLGDANLANNEVHKYQSVSSDDIVNVAKKLFQENNSTTLLYKKL